MAAPTVTAPETSATSTSIQDSVGSLSSVGYAIKVPDADGDEDGDENSPALPVIPEEDEEEDEDEEKAENNIPVSHPLYEIRTHVRDLFEWQRVKMIELYESLKLQNNLESESEKFKLNVVTTIGELYLKKAAAPMRKFLKLRYGDDEENIDRDLCKESQQDAIDSIASALEYLRIAQDPDSTDSWVAVAEAYIDLGNVCDNESTEQENAYGEAEKLLRKANIAAHGRYDDVLSRFLQDQAE